MAEALSDRKRCEFYNCATCDNDTDSVSEGFCLKCCEFLCETCVFHHGRNKASRDHVILKNGDLPDSSVVFDDINNTTTCSIHSDEDLTYYCESEQEYVCARCVATKHKNSNCDIKVIGENTVDSSDTCRFLSKVLKKVTKADMRLLALKDVLKQKEDRLQAERMVSYQEELKKLNERNEQMKTAISTRCRDQISKLEEICDKSGQIKSETMYEKEVFTVCEKFYGYLNAKRTIISNRTKTRLGVHSKILKGCSSIVLEQLQWVPDELNSKPSIGHIASEPKCVYELWADLVLTNEMHPNQVDWSKPKRERSSEQIKSVPGEDCGMSKSPTEISAKNDNSIDNSIWSNANGIGQTNEMGDVPNRSLACSGDDNTKSTCSKYETVEDRSASNIPTGISSDENKDATFPNDITNTLSRESDFCPFEMQQTKDLVYTQPHGPMTRSDRSIRLGDDEETSDIVKFMITPQQKYLCVDKNNKKVKMFDVYLTSLSTKVLNQRPVDAALLKPNKVFLVFENSKQVDIADFTAMSIADLQTTFEVSHPAIAVACTTQDIIGVMTSDQSKNESICIEIRKRDGSFVRKVELISNGQPIDGLGILGPLSLNSVNINFLVGSSNGLTNINSKGALLDYTEHVDFLQVTDVAACNKDLYVCCQKSGNIYRKCWNKTITMAVNGLICPQSVCADPENKCLIIGFKECDYVELHPLPKL